MARRSSGEKAPIAASPSNSSSTSRCTSSMLKPGSTAPIIRRSARRRYSLANSCQSPSTPRRAPHSPSAATRPLCQSRIVPPVSNATTLIASILPRGLIADANGRHDKPADQFLPLVLAGQQRRPQRVQRGADAGFVPQPVAELPARRSGIADGGGFEAIGLHIVDREAQQQRRRKLLARACRRLA